MQHAFDVGPVGDNRCAPPAWQPAPRIEEAVVIVVVVVFYLIVAEVVVVVVVVVVIEAGDSLRLFTAERSRVAGMLLPSPVAA